LGEEWIKEKEGAVERERRGRLGKRRLLHSKFEERGGEQKSIREERERGYSQDFVRQGLRVQREGKETGETCVRTLSKTNGKRRSSTALSFGKRKSE